MEVVLVLLFQGDRVEAAVEPVGIILDQHNKDSQVGLLTFPQALRGGAAAVLPAMPLEPLGVPRREPMVVRGW